MFLQHSLFTQCACFLTEYKLLPSKQYSVITECANRSSCEIKIIVLLYLSLSNILFKQSTEEKYTAYLSINHLLFVFFSFLHRKEF